MFIRVQRPVAGCGSGDLNSRTTEDTGARCKRTLDSFSGKRAGQYCIAAAMYKTTLSFRNR